MQIIYNQLILISFTPAYNLIIQQTNSLTIEYLVKNTNFIEVFFICK